MRTLLPVAAASLWLVSALAVPSATAALLTDAPIVWYEDDRRDIPEPEERKVNLLQDQFHTTFVRPVKRVTSPSSLIRRIGGDPHGPAENVNTLGEVPSSSWFTNRIGLFPITPEEIARCGGDGDGPDRSRPWKVIGAKTEGVTPGFNIEDAQGDRYLIKFDKPEFAGIATGAGAIVARLFHAAGYNVPEDAVVTFGRDEVVLGDGVQIKEHGTKRDMTAEDLEAILEQVPQVAAGEYLAISSKFIDGTPVGFFDWKGLRKDDPNDRVKHENRRELRALRIFAAWVRHFDTKQGNTLDMYVEEGGARFVRHYLIDFASTLGTGAGGPSPKFGMEYGTDTGQVLGRVFSLGLHEDDWRRVERPEGLDEVGHFESEHFDPKGFKPLTPNTAFAKMRDRDGYWAAKIISAFRSEHIEAACREAKYRNPEATRYVAKTLAERRDIIAREFFTRVAPIDFFRIEGARLIGVDLGVDREIWPRGESRYRARSTAVDENREPLAAWSPWRELDRPEVKLDAAGPFHAVEFQVDRGDGWGPTVTAYVSQDSRRVVAVAR